MLEGARRSGASKNLQRRSLRVDTLPCVLRFKHTVPFRKFELTTQHTTIAAFCFADIAWYCATYRSKLFHRMCGYKLKRAAKLLGSAKQRVISKEAANAVENAKTCISNVGSAHPAFRYHAKLTHERNAKSMCQVFAIIERHGAERPCDCSYHSKWRLGDCEEEHR